MNEQKINAAYGEALLRLAVIENHKRELNAIPPRVDLEKMYRFSSEHEARMEKLFAKKQRKSIPKTVLLRRIAAAVIITLAVSFGTLLTNAEVRAAVWEAVVEWYSEFTRFVFRSADSINEDFQWYPSYLPDGFSEVSYEVVGDFTIIDYIDSLGNAITFNYNGEDRFTSVDNEHSEYSLVVEQGIAFHIHKATTDDYPSTILWELNGFSFFLKSTISPDELLKIAFSVE